MDLIKTPKKMPALLFLLLFTTTIFAKDVRFESGEYQNTMIELYTSEGCSSCPPADNWLSKLVHHPQLFSQFVPMAFHVDYWDYIGWSDEFAKPEYGERQTQHYRQGGISGRWTPQLIKNGKGNRAWRYPKKTDAVGKKVGKLKVNVIDDVAYIKFSPTQKSKSLIAHIALLGFGFENIVTAGENEDRTLKHDFVVLNHAQKSSKTNRWSIKLPHSSKTPKRLAVAVWIATKNAVKPIQVSAGWL